MHETILLSGVIKLIKYYFFSSFIRFKNRNSNLFQITHIKPILFPYKMLCYSHSCAEEGSQMEGPPPACASFLQEDEGEFCFCTSKSGSSTFPCSFCSASFQLELIDS